jgi:hypothetical protein
MFSVMFQVQLSFVPNLLNDFCDVPSTALFCTESIECFLWCSKYSCLLYRIYWMFSVMFQVQLSFVPNLLNVFRDVPSTAVFCTESTECFVWCSTYNCIWYLIYWMFCLMFQVQLSFLLNLLNVFVWCSMYNCIWYLIYWMFLCDVPCTTVPGT